jgi:hypothetical protein
MPAALPTSPRTHRRDDPSAVSHDLRTPLGVVTGMATARDGGGVMFRVSIPDAEPLPRVDESPAMTAEVR